MKIKTLVCCAIVFPLLWAVNAAADHKFARVNNTTFFSADLTGDIHGHNGFFSASSADGRAYGSYGANTAGTSIGPGPSDVWCSDHTNELEPVYAPAPEYRAGLCRAQFTSDTVWTHNADVVGPAIYGAVYLANIDRIEIRIGGVLDHTWTETKMATHVKVDPQQAQDENGSWHNGGSCGPFYVSANSHVTLKAYPYTHIDWGASHDPVAYSKITVAGHILMDISVWGDFEY